MSNKIGILTFNRSLNYGAVLQAYALQKTIEKQGYDCEIIDYESKIRKGNGKDGVGNVFALNPIYTIYRIITLPAKIRRRKKINQFLSRVKKSNAVFSVDDNIAQQYSKIFVGSDQVWNSHSKSFDLAFLLPDVHDNRKKCSYAASFGGITVKEELKKLYQEELQKFTHLSVREEAGVQIISDLLGRKPFLALDPTHLLTSEEWKKACAPRKTHDDYILFYPRAFSKRLVDFTNELATLANCKIISIDGSIKKNTRGINYTAISPGEWLTLFMHAKYIVTNSFHGIAFSINFSKPFFAELLNPRLGVNSRITTLLETYDLFNRLIDQHLPLDHASLAPIEYSKVEVLLDKKRCESMDYIKQAIDA